MILNRCTTVYGLTLEEIDKEPAGFTDIEKTPAAFKTGLNKLCLAAFINGKSTDEFDPAGTLTRAGAAKILVLTNVKLHKDPFVIGETGSILIILPSFWETRHSVFGYRKSEGTAQEPGTYCMRVNEKLNYRSDRINGLLFAYIFKDNDASVKVIQDDKGNLLPGYSVMEHVRFGENGGMEGTSIRCRPTEAESNTINPGVSRAFA